ncbi:hypothetical protein [Lacticaseibacillus zhaodongensis]|uniref:hypothetical protein n=1 Tax=Lacticaseibacillus zhaodongensis TaxID=2668065 RepID=UPI0012D2AD93|nr:hypothetical protein [Lacticaseibacillus zhaodongensis]
MATDYKRLLDQLKSGELKELRVKPDDFMAFREVWNNYPGRTEIVGSAHRGGDIVYHYEAHSA